VNRRQEIRVLSWNLFHGRDAPPDPRLLTWRSRLLRTSERGTTHIQVNRGLYPEFSRLLAAAEWDIALLQECPPRWSGRLALDCGAQFHQILTSRNAWARLRGLLADANPDLIASGEGGSNTTLVRPGAGRILERRELELAQKPERRTMAFCRLSSGVCVANLHATNDRPTLAAEELRAAAQAASAWADERPLILGGDLNLRPRHSPVFRELTERHGLSAPADAFAIDHILARGLEVVEPERSWPPEARDVEEGGLAIRLSDHAPVEARFAFDG
jgi:endonuclease/exonuclease/phosphatase family metal-dependent hydrolase